MKKIIFLSFFVLVISGCATGYYSERFTGGYQDMKIQDDIYKVSFRGNAFCGSERVADFALLRCAEVTLDNGYNYFIILDEKMTNKTGSYTTPVTAQSYGTANVYGGSNYATGSYSGTTYYSGGQTYHYNKPLTAYAIKCFQEKPVDIQVVVFDAKQIRDNLRGHYGLFEKKSDKNFNE
ncbi:MAG: hypothetical protein PHC58_05570 [Candidatus Omnitrophica bacterium]|nr:hypothetical protein [Candidatus Omnitrophota bacterium]